MEISTYTVSLLNDFVMNTGFYKTELEDIYDILLPISVDGLLEKHYFHQFVRSRTDKLSMADKSMCNLLLTKIFDAFDRSGSEVVDLVDLACGFSVLCEGEKSEKLAFAFDLIDEDKDGLLSKRGLWRYFRSFLCVLLTLSQANHYLSGVDGGGMTPREIQQVCDECAVWTASNLLREHSASQDVHSLGVSFESLAAWYTNGAYNCVMWLELLDLRKWLPLTSSLTASSGRELNVFFSCQLVSAGTEPMSLVLTQADAEFVRRLALASGLRCTSASELGDAIRLHVWGKTSSKKFMKRDRLVSEDVFADWVQSRFPAQEIQAAYMSIYRGLCIGTEAVPLSSLCTGLSVICVGSKSSKLSFGFPLFDRDSDGTLLENELVSFLGSYLTTILVLSSNFSCSVGQGRQEAEVSMKRGVLASCRAVARAICIETASSMDQTVGVDFKRFGDWYNSGGFVSLPWLELLDLEKWATTHSETSRPSSPKPPCSSSVSVVPDSGSGPPGVLCLKGRGEAYRVFTVTDAAARGVESLSVRLSLHQFSPEHLCAVLQQMSRAESSERGCSSGEQGGDGLLSRAGFDHVVSSLLATNTEADTDGSSSAPSVDGSELVHHRRTRRGVDGGGTEDEAFLVALHATFSGFDRTESDLVDVDELACALALLTKGTKSEKLAFAFDLMDEDEDASLSKRGLWRFFRSLLTAVVSLSGATADLSAASSAKLVDEASLALCNSLWERRSGTGVSFDDLADWYSAEGHRVSPWLELLDFTKWRLFALENR